MQYLIDTGSAANVVDQSTYESWKHRPTLVPCDARFYGYSASEPIEMLGQFDAVIKHGSISLAFESSRLAIPEAKFLGIRAKDFRQCGLDDAVKIDLTSNDTKRANEIAAYPWFESHKGWQKEINGLLTNGFKMEVESLITKDISYVTETYVPERLKAKDWLE